MPRPVFVTLALLLLVAPGHATTLEPKDVTCPVCDQTVTVLVVRSTNTSGGSDDDLCPHASGTQTLPLRVWVCPRCRYANRGSRFTNPVTPELKAWIAKGLEPALPIDPAAGQREILGWVKYDLLARIRTREGADPDEIGDLYLHAAWAARLEPTFGLDKETVGRAMRGQTRAVQDRFEELRSTVLVDGPMGTNPARLDIVAARAMLEETRGGEVEGARAVAQELFAAWVLRSHGENAEVMEILLKRASDEKTADPLREFARVLLRTIGWERSCQERGLPHLVRAVEGGFLEGQKRAINCHVIAETYRRLDRFEDAARWYVRALESPALPGPLLRMARDALGRIGAGTPEVTEKVARAWQSRARALIAGLRNPETTRGAHRELRLMLEPSVVPDLVGTLSHGDARVRLHAALTLGFYPDPGDAAVFALIGLARREPRKATRSRVIFALARIASVRSRAFFLELLSRKDEDHRDDAVEVLGRIGDEACVAAILALRGDRKLRRDVERALACLTNRAREPAEAFDTWWEKNRERSRKDWVVAGFRAAGIDIEDPADPKSVPALIGALADERHHIRANAFRALREISGQCFGRDEIPDHSDSPKRIRERKLAVRRWRRWLADSEKK